MAPRVTYPERNAEIIRRRKAGELPTEIAKALGITRNAVIGALNRAGCCRGDVDRSAIMKRFATHGDDNPNTKYPSAVVAAIRREHVRWDRANSARALARRHNVPLSWVKGVLYVGERARG